MHLEGSCHCGDVRFRLESSHPYPFNLCYCSICRKTSGAGGFAINISGDHSTLEVVVSLIDVLVLELAEVTLERLEERRRTRATRDVLVLRERREVTSEFEAIVAETPT